MRHPDADIVRVEGVVEPTDRDKRTLVAMYALKAAIPGTPYVIEADHPVRELPAGVRGAHRILRVYCQVYSHPQR
jgi:hypothetical protein